MERDAVNISWCSMFNGGRPRRAGRRLSGESSGQGQGGGQGGSVSHGDRRSYGPPSGQQGGHAHPHAQTYQTPHSFPNQNFSNNQNYPCQVQQPFHQPTPNNFQHQQQNFQQPPQQQNQMPAPIQNTYGNNWNQGSAGNNFTEMAAVQTQTMTRQQKLEVLRVELNSVNNQIIQVKQGVAPGNVDMNALFQKEADLKRQMFEA